MSASRFIALFGAWFSCVLLDYYVWAITGDDAPPVVVDAGFGPRPPAAAGARSSPTR